MNAAYLLGVTGTRGLFSSGSPGLDALLYGGLWRGAVHVLSGDSFAGKSLLALLLCRSVQRAGGTVLYCDTEGGFSHDFATRLGLSPRGFHAVRARVGEAAFALCEKVAKNGAADLIVLDSIHGITAREELDAPKLHTGQHTRDRLVSLGSQRLAQAAEQGGAVVVIIHRYALSESVARCAPARFAKIWLDVQRSSLRWDAGRLVEARCWVKSQRGGAMPRSIRGVLFTDDTNTRAARPEGEREMIQDGTSDTRPAEKPRPTRGRRASSKASPPAALQAGEVFCGERGPRVTTTNTKHERGIQGSEESRAARPETSAAHTTNPRGAEREASESQTKKLSAALVDGERDQTTHSTEPPMDAQSSAAGAAPRAAGAARP
jgi:archaellum biogenesis ATPase FlaH